MSIKKKIKKICWRFQFSHLLCTDPFCAATKAVTVFQIMGASVYAMQN